MTCFDAESAHQLALWFLRIAGDFAPARAVVQSMAMPPAQNMAIEALGLHFDHPLGLAAGFDKEGHALRGLQALGFSFVEMGTVTPHPQPGNARPRLFRLTEDRALINRLGFPSRGKEEAARNLARFRRIVAHFPVGVSLGKNKETPLQEAFRDYEQALEATYGAGDFFVINMSSPNTPELRRLQSNEFLSDLLAALYEKIEALSYRSSSGLVKPLLVKIAPDLEWAEIDTLLDLCLQHKIAGIVATNTTLDRKGLKNRNQDEMGGLSGAPLNYRSTEIIRHIARHTGSRLTVIGVGGIFSGDDIWEKMDAGAHLVQAYTGFVYEGPLFVRKVLAQLQKRMRQEGVAHLRDIIGSRKPR